MGGQVNETMSLIFPFRLFAMTLAARTGHVSIRTLRLLFTSCLDPTRSRCSLPTPPSTFTSTISLCCRTLPCHSWSSSEPTRTILLTSLPKRGGRTHWKWLLKNSVWRVICGKPSVRSRWIGMGWVDVRFDWRRHGCPILCRLKTKERWGRRQRSMSSDPQRPYVSFGTDDVLSKAEKKRNRSRACLGSV